MILKFYEIKLKSKKKLVDFWYFLMKPLAYFFTVEKENSRYNKKQAKITEEQAIKWMAEDIAMYIIKRPRTISILICDFANEDDCWRGCTLKYNNLYFNRDKTKHAYYKYSTMDIAFQEKIISRLKEIKGIHIVESIDTFTWEDVRNYHKTYTVSIPKS